MKRISPNSVRILGSRNPKCPNIKAINNTAEVPRATPFILKVPNRYPKNKMTNKIAISMIWKRVYNIVNKSTTTGELHEYR
jgi:hypothetical protein